MKVEEGQCGLYPRENKRGEASMGGGLGHPA